MVRTECDLLICDEPNSGLDAEAVADTYRA